MYVLINYFCVQKVSMLNIDPSIDIGFFVVVDKVKGQQENNIIEQHDTK